MGSQVFRFLRKLDGKHDPQFALPGVYPREVQEMLDALSQEELVRHSNVLCKSFLSVYYSLWYPKCTRSRSVVPGVLDMLRMLLWLPVCLAGIFSFWNNIPQLSNESMWIGILLGSFVGLIAHELSHGLSCLHWGGRFFEIGIMLHYGIPGMYVLIDQSPIRSRSHKVLVSSAGIEMNLMLTGIFAGLASLCQPISLSLLMAANANLWLALVNLLPATSLDGMSILCLLLGYEQANKKVCQLFRSKRLQLRLMKKGFPGYIELLACVILTVIPRILTSILIVLSIFEVISICKLLYV